MLNSCNLGGWAWLTAWLTGWLGGVGGIVFFEVLRAIVFAWVAIESFEFASGPVFVIDFGLGDQCLDLRLNHGLAMGLGFA